MLISKPLQFSKFVSTLFELLAVNVSRRNNTAAAQVTTVQSVLRTRIYIFTDKRM